MNPCNVRKHDDKPILQVGFHICGLTFQGNPLPEVIQSQAREREQHPKAIASLFRRVYVGRCTCATYPKAPQSQAVHT